MNPAKFLLVFLALIVLSSALPAQEPAPAASSSNPTASAQPANLSLADAEAKLENGQLDAAIAELNKIRAHDPNTPGLARALGIASFRRGDFATTAAELKPVIEQHPDDPEAVQLLGLSYYYLGRTQDAIPLLERVHGWFPKANVDASYVLGISYLRVSDYEKARKAFAEMYGIAPDSAAGHLVFARMLLREGYDPIAEQELLKAAALDPRLPGVHLFLGEVYTYKAQMDKAIAELKQELAINPVNAEALYKLADAYTRVQNWEDAQRYLQRSIWLDSTATGPYVLMAKVLLKKNEYVLSARAAQKAISMDPNNYYAHYLLGQALVKLGKTAEAESEMKISQALQTGQNHNAAELKVKKNE